jgi:ABC-2 type transport system permease protein
MPTMKSIHLQIAANPILIKELRSRMRGPRAFLTLTGVLFLLGGVSYLLYRLALATQNYSYAPLSPQIGQSLFITLAFLELMMICAVAPAVTAGAISGEEEKMTLEMLMATPLAPASILWGKLISALSYVFLLIFAAIPMASLIFIFGGVSPRDLIKALIVLLSVAISLGVLGLFMSVWLKRTARATIVSYLIEAVLVFGTLFIYVAAGIIRQAEPPRWLLVPNPISALFSALSPTTPIGSSPFGLFGYLGMGLGGNLQVLTGSTISLTSIPRPIYHYSLPLYGAVTLALYLLSTRLVLPTRRWRLTWKEASLSLGSFLLLGGGVALAFLTSADRYENVSIFASSTPEPPVVNSQRMPVIMAPAPTEAPVIPPAAANTLLTEDEQAVIYAAVIRQIYTVDYFTNQPPPAATLYLVPTTDDSVGDPNQQQLESRQLPDSLLSAVAAALFELPGKVSVMVAPPELPFDPDTGLVKDGAIITLGNIQMQDKSTVQVSIALYIDNAGGGAGYTYVLAQNENTWQVTGDTGNSWKK